MAWALGRPWVPAGASPASTVSQGLLQGVAGREGTGRPVAQHGSWAPPSGQEGIWGLPVSPVPPVCLLGHLFCPHLRLLPLSPQVPAQSACPSLHLDSVAVHPMHTTLPWALSPDASRVGRHLADRWGCWQDGQPPGLRCPPARTLGLRGRDSEGQAAPRQARPWAGSPRHGPRGLGTAERRARGPRPPGGRPPLQGPRLAVAPYWPSGW